MRYPKSSISRNEFTCDDIGITPVWLYVWDRFGNIDSCLAFVTITGNEPPVAQDDQVSFFQNVPQLVFVLVNDRDPTQARHHFITCSQTATKWYGNTGGLARNIPLHSEPWIQRK